jgi:hypothetical protein
MFKNYLYWNIYSKAREDEEVFSEQCEEKDKGTEEPFIY